MPDKHNPSSSEGSFGLKLNEKWQAIQKYPHRVEDYIHQNQGPWPQPAPDNPVGQMAEVIHLPDEELKDWKKNVGNRYIWRVLTQWPKGLWYALTHNRYKEFDDAAFNEEISEGLYSKFLTPLDEGDLELFKHPDLNLDPDPELYLKADFSCMEPIAPHCLEGMYAAPTITLLKKNHSDVYGQRHKVLAIYLYQVEYDNHQNQEALNNPHITEENVYVPEDGDHWHLSKYFVLQGAVHRVNLTEHALLHFPYDPINAVTKSILPQQHLLFQLLIPHLRLSLGVNKAVLENPGSLINRGKRKFYSPFSAEGIYIRQLLPDGYLGRGDKKKNAYPVFDFSSFPKIPPSGYGDFLQAYYRVFEDYVPRILNHIADEGSDEAEEFWLYVAIWVASIHEWLPGSCEWEEIVTNGKPVPAKADKSGGREKLEQMVTLIMWDLSVAHANDHIAIHKKRPAGNPFRIRVAPPSKQKPVDPAWREKMVWRRDLLTFWFTDLLFYKPNNVTALKDVIYPFNIKDKQKEQELKRLNKEFLAALQQCEDDMIAKGITPSSRLDEISTSLQY